MGGGTCWLTFDVVDSVVDVVARKGGSIRHDVASP